MCRRMLYLPPGGCARLLTRLETDARQATRAAVTARLHGMSEANVLLGEAYRTNPAAMVDELVSLGLTTLRLAAAALRTSPGVLLAALLEDRAMLEPAGGQGG